MANIEEIYKNVVGYEGFYMVSSKGNVKSLPRTQMGGNAHNKSKNPVYRLSRILKPTLSNNGYLRVGLTIENKTKIITIHRLVAISFIPNPLNKKTVNHLNGIKTDNRVENLEWATSSENSKHAYNTLGCKIFNKGILNSTNPKPVNQLTKSGDFVRIHVSCSDAARYLGLPLGSISTISEIARGKGRSKTCGGFKLAYPRRTI